MIGETFFVQRRRFDQMKAELKGNLSVLLTINSYLVFTFHFKYFLKVHSLLWNNVELSHCDREDILCPESWPLSN